MIILEFLGFVLRVCIYILLAGTATVFTVGFVIGIFQGVRKEFRGKKRKPAKRKQRQEVRPKLRVLWPD